MQPKTVEKYIDSLEEAMSTFSGTKRELVVALMEGAYLQGQQSVIQTML